MRGALAAAELFLVTPGASRHRACACARRSLGLQHRAAAVMPQQCNPGAALKRRAAPNAWGSLHVTRLPP